MKDYTCHLGVNTYKPNGYININKYNENLQIFFTLNRVRKPKDVDSNQMLVLMNSGKCELHIYFTFLQEFYLHTSEII